MSYETDKKLVLHFAAQMLTEGLRAFIAESGTHGFFTDKDGTRVVSFEVRLGTLKFGGNYDRPIPHCGTGWTIEREDAETYAGLLQLTAPRWALRDLPKGSTAQIGYDTLESHLARYQDSSRFAEFFSA